MYCTEHPAMLAFVKSVLYSWWMISFGRKNTSLLISSKSQLLFIPSLCRWTRSVVQCASIKQKHSPLKTALNSWFVVFFFRGIEPACRTITCKPCKFSIWFVIPEFLKSFEWDFNILHITTTTLCPVPVQCVWDYIRSDVFLLKKWQTYAYWKSWKLICISVVTGLHKAIWHCKQIFKQSSNCVS